MSFRWYHLTNISANWIRFDLTINCSLLTCLVLCEIAPSNVWTSGHNETPFSRGFFCDQTVEWNWQKAKCQAKNLWVSSLKETSIFDWLLYSYAMDPGNIEDGNIQEIYWFRVWSLQDMQVFCQRYLVIGTPTCYNHLRQMRASCSSLKWEGSAFRKLYYTQQNIRNKKAPKNITGHDVGTLQHGWMTCWELSYVWMTTPI